MRQVSIDTSRASSASCQAPSSARTSTRAIPVCWAQATPATVTRPAGTVPPVRGTSTRDCVFTGACSAHPRCSQYDVNPAKVVSSMSVSHLQPDT